MLLDLSSVDSEILPGALNCRTHRRSFGNTKSGKRRVGAVSLVSRFGTLDCPKSTRLRVYPAKPPSTNKSR